MKRPQRQFIYHVVIALCLAVTLFTAVSLLAQNKKLNEQNNSISQQIKDQTDINQRYLRCILLIERDKFQNVETRVAAIDKCAIESKTPDGKSTGTQPTSEEQKSYAQPVPVPQSEPLPGKTGGSVNPPLASPPETQTSNPQPQPNSPSLIEQVTKPIKDLLGL